METLKRKIQNLGLSRTDLEDLLQRTGAPKPIRTEPLDWSPEVIEAYLDQWSQTLECQKRLSGSLHPFHTNPSAYLSERQVCQKLGVKGSSAWTGFIQNRGMPEPEVCTHYFGDYSHQEYVWEQAAWHDWYAQMGSKPAPKSLASKTLEALKANPRTGYAQVSQDWIHGSAAKKGRKLTHALTISFTSTHGRDGDLATIKQINELERGQVRRLSRKIPRKVWRRFKRVRFIPEDKFFHCVWPECHSKSGNPARWHFHVELFLSESEARFMKNQFAKIEQAIRRGLADFADGRTINIKLEAVNSGYNSYSSKDAFCNLDVIWCNFVKLAPKYV